MPFPFTSGTRRTLTAAQDLPGNADVRSRTRRPPCNGGPISPVAADTSAALLSNSTTPLSHKFSLRSSASPDNNACHLLLRITRDPGYVADDTHNDSVRKNLDTSSDTHSPGPTVFAQISEVPEVEAPHRLEADGGSSKHALSKIDRGMPSPSQSSGTFGPTKARPRRFCRVVPSSGACHAWNLSRPVYSANFVQEVAKWHTCLAGRRPIR
jgi:hypothetical protein